MENKPLKFSPFYIGQEVIYITGNNMAKDSEHKIRKVYKFPCGCYTVCVSCPDPAGTKSYIRCAEHGTTLPESSSYKHFRYDSFRPKNPPRMERISYSKVVEQAEICSN